MRCDEDCISKQCERNRYVIKSAGSSAPCFGGGGIKKGVCEECKEGNECEIGKSWFNKCVKKHIR